MPKKMAKCKKEKNEFQKDPIKNCTCHYFNDIIIIEDFGLYNIVINEKSHENILIYNISSKTLIDPKPLHIRLDKIDGLIRIYNGTICSTLFSSKNMMLFTTKLDIFLV